MIISKNSQLGLNMDDPQMKVEILDILQKQNKSRLDLVKTTIDDFKKKETKGVEISLTEDEKASFEVHFSDLQTLKNAANIRERVAGQSLPDTYDSLLNNKDARLYLICSGVEACSKMIRIGDNFSSKALRNIKLGKHTYLLGKGEMCRFIRQEDGIIGFYWHRDKGVAFEFGFDLQDDGYYFDEQHAESFNRVAKIMTFVELGDIDVVRLDKGANNGKAKKDGKITNTSAYTVYVVDSSWNKLIIRTDGFAVMGHFRLQACGAGLTDRKLIWINAFEKHGYTRRPKAEIID
jgi:hypothetical protein